jgi:hypothetical protein
VYTRAHQRDPVAIGDVHLEARARCGERVRAQAAGRVEDTGRRADRRQRRREASRAQGRDVGAGRLLEALRRGFPAPFLSSRLHHLCTPL